MGASFVFGEVNHYYVELVEVRSTLNGHQVSAEQQDYLGKKTGIFFVALLGKIDY